MTSLSNALMWWRHVPGERPITTVLVLKPDVACNHLSKLLKRVTHEGFRVVALRQLVLDEPAIEQIVPAQDQQVHVHCWQRVHVHLWFEDMTMCNFSITCIYYWIPLWFWCHLSPHRTSCCTASTASTWPVTWRWWCACSARTPSSASSIWSDPPIPSRPSESRPSCGEPCSASTPSRTRSTVSSVWRQGYLNRLE